MLSSEGVCACECVLGGRYAVRRPARESEHASGLRLVTYAERLAPIHSRGTQTGWQQADGCWLQAMSMH